MNELEKEIRILENKHFELKGKGDADFDKEDVLKTLRDSQSKIKKIISSLEALDIKQKDAVDNELVNLTIEYANILWCYDELRDFVIRILR